MPVNRCAVALLAVGCFAVAAYAGSVGPSPYLQASDSPFSGGSFTYFHLENFEDHLLNTPGVSGNNGGVTSVVFGPSVHDSVDADDGSIDGSGLTGDGWFVADGNAGVKFSFNAGALGSLPTHAGMAWTDGSGQVTFTAFGPGDVPLGTIGPISDASFPNGSFNGETAEDRFFGWTDAGGISAIFISNSGGGLEVDHLQYGAGETITPPPVIPLPPGVWAGLGLLACIGLARLKAQLTLD